MRVGILGGTFDPIHEGHLYMAKKVLDKLSLDKILFIPTYLPPHKKNIRIANAPHRYNMVKLAIANNSKFQISDIEIKRKGRSYSVVTLKELRRRYGCSAEIFFIAGSDSLEELDKWKDMGDILKLCNFVIIKRPHYAIKNPSSNFIILNINAKDISSTDIRSKIKENQSVTKMLPKKVRDYIKRHKLYGE